MTIRSRAIARAVGIALLTVAASGASAGELISPASVLADKGSQRGVNGFSNRTARISSIMGPELSRQASVRPHRRAAIRRDADALAGLR